MFIAFKRRPLSILKSVQRAFSTSNADLPEREKMNYDVVIVGGGPAGLSTAIQLKKLEKKHEKPINVCLIEKGSDFGAHILSGNCFETSGLDMLFPNWREMEKRPPVNTKVTEDRFYLVWGENSQFKVPNIFLPKAIHNTNNYVISLGSLCKLLAEQAQELGVDVFTGFAGEDVVLNEKGKVVGITTGDFGVSKTGARKENYSRGMELLGSQVVLSEGCRGSISEKVISKFNLRDQKDVQTYGIGLKEVWEIKPEKFKAGLVQHTVGWPLPSNVYGGSFMYHIEPNLCHVGLVVGLDYKNPYLSPYEEFQKMKTQTLFKNILEGGTCISYGAKALNEGGYFAVPKLTFPGGVLTGCSAGFLNVEKIKGAHNAMKSGILAADNIYRTIVLEGNAEPGLEISSYEQSVKESSIYEELYKTRNFKAGFKGGLYKGLVHGALLSWVTRGREPWNLRIAKKDSELFTKASENQQIKYPKHDGVLTFDLLENLARSGTNHDHDQPSHLKIKNDKAQKPLESFKLYGAPEERFCPAKVYEFIVDEKTKEPRLQINAQNCLHCKTCSIKMIDEYIDWTVPEGNGGPNYSGM